MWIDIFVAALLAVVTILMGYLGVHVTLHPQDSPSAKKWYKSGFIACALVSVSLVIVQGIRTGKAQNGFKRAVEGAASDAREANQRIDRLTQDHGKEIARREQAEKDLAIIVQATGQATRTGVVTDLKRSPLTVQVDNRTNPETEQRFAIGIQKYITVGVGIQEYFVSSDNVAEVKTRWFKWKDDTVTYLRQIGPSYAVQFDQAHGSAFMGCPARRNIEGCNYWQDIQGKNDALSSILVELRRGH